MVVVAILIKPPVKRTFPTNALSATDFGFTRYWPDKSCSRGTLRKSTRTALRRRYIYLAALPPTLLFFSLCAGAIDSSLHMTLGLKWRGELLLPTCHFQWSSDYWGIFGNSWDCSLHTFFIDSNGFCCCVEEELNPDNTSVCCTHIAAVLRRYAALFICSLVLYPLPMVCDCSRAFLQPCSALFFAVSQET